MLAEQNTSNEKIREFGQIQKNTMEPKPNDIR